ncbi:MAG: AMIN domain-containing protein, partial [Cyanobacteria bacterium P01_F01_bin.153]
MVKLAYGASWMVCIGVIAALAAVDPASAELATIGSEDDLETVELTPAATRVEPGTIQGTFDGELGFTVAQEQPIAITDIRIEEAEDGFLLRLETSAELTPPVLSVSGNAAIANIPNAVLNLSNRDAFSVSDPAEGIALLEITNSPDNQVRIAITGNNAPPQVEISTTPGEVTAAVSLGIPLAQGEDDAIQIGVTGEQDEYFVPSTSGATRTDTPVLDIPASIQVVPRRILDDQQVIRLDEALANVSGVSRGGTFSNLTLDFSVR